MVFILIYYQYYGRFGQICTVSKSNFSNRNVDYNKKETWHTKKYFLQNSKYVDMRWLPQFKKTTKYNSTIKTVDKIMETIVCTQ